MGVLRDALSHVSLWAVPSYDIRLPFDTDCQKKALPVTPRAHILSVVRRSILVRAPTVLHLGSYCDPETHGGYAGFQSRHYRNAHHMQPPRC